MSFQIPNKYSENEKLKKMNKEWKQLKEIGKKWDRVEEMVLAMWDAPGMPGYNQNASELNLKEQKLRVKRLTETSIRPTKAYKGDAGWDLYADCKEDITLEVGKRILISTGCAFAIPEGFYGRIADRSSVAWKSGCHVLAGVIDNSYRGEVKIVLLNLGTESFIIKHGDKIAQLVITKISDEELIEVENLNDTQRGEEGFGSSNN